MSATIYVGSMHMSAVDHDAIDQFDLTVVFHGQERRVTISGFPPVSIGQRHDVLPKELARLAEAILQAAQEPGGLQWHPRASTPK
jgi:hypothetical protein